MSVQAFLEFHGSRLVSAVEEHGVLELYIDGYVHEWQEDGGTSFRQPLCLVLTQITSTPLPPLPRRLSDGTVAIGSTVHEGSLPLPLEQLQGAVVELGFFDGTSVRVSGASLTVRSCGERLLLERLPAELRP